MDERMERAVEAARASRDIGHHRYSLQIEAACSAYLGDDEVYLEVDADDWEVDGDGALLEPAQWRCVVPLNWEET